MGASPGEGAAGAVGEGVETPAASARPLLEVDWTHALGAGAAEPDGGAAGLGMTEAALAALGPRLAASAAAVAATVPRGAPAFWSLPARRDLLDPLLAWVATRRSARDVILVGIGGSALGARVLAALAPVGSPGPRLHVLDTVDPAPVMRVTRGAEPGESLLLAISLSGRTLETMAVFAVLETWMEAALGQAARERIAVVCGGDANPLRAHAQVRGLATFPVPEGVGGRYAVLSPVGLLPALLAGCEPEPLLAGAGDASIAALRPEPSANPALALAGLLHLAWTAGRRTVVHWTYGERLAPVGPWWAQLVAESLGKIGPDGPVGLTPVVAEGPRDQHSLLQLLMEGPDDKLVLVLSAERDEDGAVVVPASHRDLTEAAGRPLTALLAAAREGTVYALRRAGRPVVQVRLRDEGLAAVGALLFTWEAAVVHLAHLWEVDPFDQPAVVLGKRAALASLTGSPAALAEAMRPPQPPPRHRSTLGNPRA